MSNARWRRWATAAVVLGVIMLPIAYFMRQSGNEHQRDYAAFQRCLHEPSSDPVGTCTLEQKGSNADSPAAYKDNYELQLRLGAGGMVLGAVLLVGGVTLLVLHRRHAVTLPAKT
jgi:hypothetical protein